MFCFVFKLEGAVPARILNGLARQNLKLYKISPPLSPARISAANWPTETGDRAIAKSLLLVPLLLLLPRDRSPSERGNGGGGAAADAQMRGRPNGAPRRQTPLARGVGRRARGERAGEPRVGERGDKSK